jgi:hypothetical protein
MFVCFPVDWPNVFVSNEIMRLQQLIDRRITIFEIPIINWYPDAKKINSHANQMCLKHIDCDCFSDNIKTLVLYIVFGIVHLLFKQLY